MRSAPVGVLLPIAPQLVAQRIDANKYYRAAISTPQLVDALELRAAALQARSALPRIPAVPLPTNAVDLEAWLEAVAHTGELERQRATRDDALAHLIARQDALVGSIAADADRALAILNTAMTEVMGIASVLVSRLGGHHNAAAIVAAGDPDVLAAWQDMRRLRADEYDQIRAAEGWIRAGDPRELNYRSNWLYNDDLASDFTASNMEPVPAVEATQAGIRHHLGHRSTTGRPAALAERSCRTTSLDDHRRRAHVGADLGAARRARAPTEA